MKGLKLALCLAVALVWAGAASPVFAFQTSPHAAQAHVNMTDCPAHAAGKMTMDKGACAVACYGLAAADVAGPMKIVVLAEASDESLVSFYAVLQSTPLHGVPTPPPDLLNA